MSEWPSLSNWNLSRQIPQERNASTIYAGLWRKVTGQNLKSSAHCSAKDRNSIAVCRQKQLTSVLEEYFKIQPKFEASSSHGKPTRWLADSRYKSPAKCLHSVESSQQEQLKFEVRNPCLPKEILVGAVIRNEPRNPTCRPTPFLLLIHLYLTS